MDFMHNISTLHDTDAFIYIILDLWKSIDGLILNIGYYTRPTEDKKTIVHFKPEYSSQYSLSSFARKWQNTFQQGIDILQKTF